MAGAILLQSEFKEKVMPTKRKEMQRFIRLYKEETGIKEIDMHKVAKFAVKKGWSLPKPQDPLTLLAKQFSGAAREEIRKDITTGNPYRANHALSVKQGSEQFTLWIDIDEAPRKPMLKSLINRREQMVGDGLHLTLDADHWNGIHPEEEPIELPLDFTDDIEWRKNGPKEQAS